MWRRSLLGAVRPAFAAAAGGAGVAAPTLTGTPTLLASWDFDNDSTVSLTGSDINSISGADGTSVTLTSGSSKPTRAARSGKNTGLFALASGQYMQIASNIGVSTNPVSVAVIFEPVSNALTQAVFDIGNGAGALGSDRHIVLLSTTSGYNWRKIGFSASSTATVGTSFANSLALLVGVSPSGTTAAEINMDGAGTAVVAGATSALPLPGSLTHTTLGSSRESGANVRPFDGYIWRVLVYAANLTSTQREEIATWANTNYGTTNAA